MVLCYGVLTRGCALVSEMVCCGVRSCDICVWCYGMDWCYPQEWCFFMVSKIVQWRCILWCSKIVLSYGVVNVFSLWCMKRCYGVRSGGMKRDIVFVLCLESFTARKRYPS